MCNKCGKCCNPIILTSELTNDSKADNTPSSWLQEHWRLFRVIYGGNFYFYDCDFFDHGTKMCRDYENRPGVCTDYPDKYDDPISQESLFVGCSFRKEIL